MIDNSNGRKWARFALTLALLASVVGNVVHTVLAESVVSLWLRVPAAVLWPVFTFLGIEVLVRIIWERSFTHRLARNMVLLPAVPAAIVSYEHLYSLLGLMGERHLIQVIGPLAVDGTMIGMTMVLLLTRPLPAASMALEEIDLDATLVKWTAEAEEAAATPVSPAPMSIERPRRVRTTTGEIPAGLKQAVDLLMAGASVKDAAEQSGQARSTVGRYGTVRGTLKDNPMADIADPRVKPELVAVMRDHYNRERAL